MKAKILFSFITLSLLSFVSNGQYGNSSYNFEWDDLGYDTLYLDTMSNPGNIWQIGEPQKNVLSTALSSPNVIITDTINHYPINDTSSFIYEHIASLGIEFGQFAQLKGYYFVDSDSTDFGDIELSLDNGSSWTSILSDPLFNIYWVVTPPILYGSSSNWTEFTYELHEFNWEFGVQEGDTLQFRFTFISDSIQTNRDGLMFDNLSFEENWMGINQYVNDKICVYPNPTKNVIYISFTQFEKKLNQTYVIVDKLGRKIFSGGLDSNKIDVGQLETGVYSLHLKEDGNLLGIKTIVVE